VSGARYRIISQPNLQEDKNADHLTSAVNEKTTNYRNNNIKTDFTGQIKILQKLADLGEQLQTINYFRNTLGWKF